jgi:hypothetical protein
MPLLPAAAAAGGLLASGAGSAGVAATDVRVCRPAVSAASRFLNSCSVG